MDSAPSVTHLGLCAGYGGIELGLKRAIPDLRTVALCEIEAFAISNLVAKMEAGFMDPAPIWPNLKTFPWEEFRDRVDILTGGYPCQPFSAAGQRKGKQDPRHLWPWIADGIRLLRPRICFFENVEGHISLGLSDVIEDLAGMGYRTTFGIFSAAEVGAPHQRKRVFILAVSSGLGGASGLSGSVQRHEGQSGESDDGCGEDLGNAIGQGVEGPHNNGSVSERVQSDSIKSSAWPSRPGEQQYGWEPPRVVGNAEECGFTESGSNELQTGINDALGNASCETRSSLGDTESPRTYGTSAPMAGEEHQEEGGEPQSGDIGQTAWNDGDGTPEELRQAQPPLGGDADGSPSGLDYAQLCVSCDNRTDELRLLGNGVVPATAERAFRILLGELVLAI